ncbi:MAG TPA: alpha/beta hydrolase [Phenylobacterium sp.]|uniref:alpha/beta fold hydrolase n=1 Tax=Phenylobacterium sp. TaxID=1871053 RepID=UPI002B459F89|nr:alpha/beta hydrolase [Phenylobacterium sp.]HKR87644.1 alpha/beta hydrolase [Phenylobacterium sp.]HKT54838.1 alpha/beta hydrolase [Caulobacteraceae bacterium]
MARVDIEGVGIEYEVIGEGPPAVITAGGRFSKSAPGIRELAEILADGGLSAIVWDRPNCGASDLCFQGETEARLNAAMLAGLVGHVGRGPALLIGGSAGARISLITAAFHPQAVSKLFLVWISGGPVSLAALGSGYTTVSALAAADGGMEMVAALPDWEEQIRLNPGNRARLLAQDPDAFIETMQRWCAAFFPSPGSPAPGLTVEDFGRLSTPTLVLRSGRSDIFHPRQTSEEVCRLIRGATLAEPPWGEREFIERMAARDFFARWSLMAPQILEFARG